MPPTGRRGVAAKTHMLSSTDVPLLIGRKRADSIVVAPELLAVLYPPVGITKSDEVLTRLRRLPGRIVCEDAETGVLLIEVPGFVGRPRSELRTLRDAEFVAVMSGDASELRKLRCAFLLARAHKKCGAELTPPHADADGDRTLLTNGQWSHRDAAHQT